MRIRTVAGVLSAVGLAAVLATPVLAAEAATTPGQREFTAKMGVCNTCHGPNGAPRTTKTPVIWGQQENYLAKQLDDFRKNNRHVEIMNWMATTLEPEEVNLAVDYLSKRTWPARAANAATPAAPRGIAVCQACHQQNYLGTVQSEGMSTPRLAGQTYEYLVQEMQRFADGERTNNADMVQIMKGISAADREAMARYLSSL